MFYKTNTTTDLKKFFSLNTLVVPMHNKVTYLKILLFLISSFEHYGVI